MEMWEILMQVLTPPFLQVLLLPAATLAVTYVLLWASGINNPRIRSIFYSLTLFVPLVVYYFYRPSIWVTRIVPHSVLDLGGFVVQPQEEIVGVNFTGLLCIAGLVFGAVVLLISYAFGTSIVKRLQGVVEVDTDDEPWLYGIVEKAAKKVGTSMPKVGITDNLQPNAFTVGFGRSTIVVFSSGIISTLSSGELEAVAGHELAHVKNWDFHLLAGASALRVVSFFNPISHLSSSMLAREREFLADEVGAKSTHRGATLRRALIKIASTQFDAGLRLPDLLSSLFVYSNIGSMRAAFTSHPSLDTRVTRIDRAPAIVSGEMYRAITVALLIIGSFAVAFYLVEPFHIMEVFLKICSTLGLRPLGLPNHLGSTLRMGGDALRPHIFSGRETAIVILLPG